MMKLNKDNFIFTIKTRKFGDKIKEICYVYEEGFSYSLASFPLNELTQEEWLEIENSKTSEMRIFEKITILFQKKVDVQYGIYLTLEGKSDKNIEDSVEEIFTIGVHICKLFVLIQDQFLALLESKKDNFMSDVRMTIYEDMIDFYESF